MRVLGILAIAFVLTRGFQLDLHSCKPVENRDFKITELHCELTRNGLYTFNGERPQLQYIDTILINRVNEHSLIQIEKPGVLKTIREAIEVYVTDGVCFPTTTPMTTSIKLEETGEPEILEKTTDTMTTNIKLEETGEPEILEETTKQDDRSSFRPFHKSEHTTGPGVDTEHSSQDDIPSSIVWIYPTVTAIIDSFIYITVSLLTLTFAIMRRYPELRRFTPFLQPENLNQLDVQPMAPAQPMEPIQPIAPPQPMPPIQPLAPVQPMPPIQPMAPVQHTCITRSSSASSESVKDVLILLCGKDDSIENVRLLVHESILLANSIGARGQRLGNPSTETPAAKGMNVTFLPNFG
ncbi:unnamed protein product [Mytilus edulis]|uniref:Uncharacterized protein n=1 Tax=Mytilus edulis TaxID=6550 RepID=A0A8S3TK43_MYTED|nr:unnamed protein product [Mytilus edulis]